MHEGETDGQKKRTFHLIPAEKKRKEKCVKTQNISFSFSIIEELAFCP